MAEGTSTRTQRRTEQLRYVAVLALVTIGNGAVVALADDLLGTMVSPFSWKHMAGNALYQVAGITSFIAIWRPKW